MPRLPLVSPEPDDEVAAAVFATSRAEGREPIALYRALAHSPLLLSAYAGLARGLRYDAQTPRDLRELLILRVAQLTRSDYEWAHHRAMAAAAGVDDAKARAVADWPASALFDERERVALRCVDEMHEIALSDAAYAALEAAFGGAQAVELVMLVSVYEAVARMIQALGLTVEPEYQRYDDRTAG